MPEALKTFLSPRDLAAAIGVSESSLKRWADAGSLRTARTAGGHRRIPLAEAVRFVRETRCGVARPDLLGFPGTAPADAGGTGDAAARLADALRRDDPASARAVLLGEFLAGTPIAEIVDGPLRIALEGIGELWLRGAEGILVEHRAIDAAVQALSTMRSALVEPGPAAPTAIGGAVSGDPYVLPSLAAAMVLVEAGLRAVNLGPDLPVEAMLVAVGRYRPALVWRSAGAGASLAQVMADAERIAAALEPWGGRVAVGGRCCGGARSERGRVCLLGSMADLFAVGRAVAGSGAPGASGRA